MKQHIIGFDYLRVIAMFSVVWIHGCDTSQTLSWLNTVNMYAVPCFIMMSVFLTLRSLNQRSIDRVEYIKRRAARLLIPLIVWSVAYYAMRFGKSIVLSDGASIDWSVMDMLKGEASYQLWFLPALFLYQVIILYCFGLFRWDFRISASVIFLCLGIAIYSASSLWLDSLRGGFDFLFLYYLPFLFLVFLIVRLAEHFGSNFFKKLSYIFVPALILALFVGLGGYSYLVLYTTVLFLLALVVPFSRRSVVTTLSANSMGIYLLHGFFLEGGQACASIIGIDLTNTVLTLALIVAAYILSLITSILMRRFSFVRDYWILG